MKKKLIITALVIAIGISLGANAIAGNGAITVVYSSGRTVEYTRSEFIARHTLSGSARSITMGGNEYSLNDFFSRYVGGTFRNNAVSNRTAFFVMISASSPQQPQPRPPQQSIDAATPAVSVSPLDSSLEGAVQAGKTHRCVIRLFPDVSTQDIQAAFEQEVIRLVNEIRMEHGLQPFVYHSDLARIARIRATETIEHNARYTHRSPVNGLEHTAYANAMGLNVVYAGESAVWERLTPKEAVESWMDSPPHRDFILSGARGSRFTFSWRTLNYIGVGFSFGEYHASDTAWMLWLMPGS
jgi:uncharacterized protein YkwD